MILVFKGLKKKHAIRLLHVRWMSVLIKAPVSPVLYFVIHLCHQKRKKTKRITKRKEENNRKETEKGIY